ncbi:flagellar hook capping FlgD N-terminal domain-containing protein [Nocardioides sp. LS1]|uniref:flagellar hook capping FlgD N-terminal domain-containing protein n=1 Tax=Nocardioides sp. LS1 TaxID=1027620 RepID=UPI000FFA5A3F|nr:flagellar hook capping FlgD N-terminal domain-containing protein [Nocardioides sp. LS1]GCD89544.1 flagellar basal body rod modification protein FlgD [Nocardioides sp. LS1]
MSIPSVEPVSTGMYQQTTPAPGTSGPDKEMFLQLLVAQLRYQDPMNPADSSQFLSQSAQFTSLEKMQDVADQTSALLSAQVSFGASNLVGKPVTYLDADGGSVSGTVQSVTFDANGPMLVVDGALVSLGQVQTVGAPYTPPSTDDPTPDTPSTP